MFMLRKKFPMIVTVGDVTPLIFPTHYPPGIKGKLSFLRQKIGKSHSHNDGLTVADRKIAGWFERTAKAVPII